MHSRDIFFLKLYLAQVFRRVGDLADSIEDWNLHCFNQTTNRFWSLVVDHYRSGIRTSHKERTGKVRCFTVGIDDGHASRRHSLCQSLNQPLLGKVLTVAASNPRDATAHKQVEQQERLQTITRKPASFVRLRHVCPFRINSVPSRYAANPGRIMAFYQKGARRYDKNRRRKYLKTQDQARKGCAPRQIRNAWRSIPAGVRIPAARNWGKPPFRTAGLYTADIGIT